VKYTLARKIFLPPKQTELALTKNSVTVVNQNGSRFLYLKQTLSRARGAMSRNRYLWICKLQKSQQKAHLLKPTEVKEVVLKKI
jgi:hypothetical protein